MHPENYIFKDIRNHDYIHFYEEEIGFRKDFDYPPFSRMTLIEVRGGDARHVTTIASKVYFFMERFLRKYPKGMVEVFKPTPALIYKIKNKYRYHIIIKALKSQNESHLSLKQLQNYINELKLKSNEQ